MDKAVRDYVDAIAAERRPLFDRIHRLVLEAPRCLGAALLPDAHLRGRSLPPLCRVWKHGVSFYGWEQGRDSGFSARHPELVTTKRTIRLRPDDAAAIRDDELRDLLRAALGG